MALKRLLSAHETSRLEAFTDAVVAVALTLLVVPITDLVAEKGDELTVQPILYVWSHDKDYLISYLATFYVVAWCWMAHRRLFAMVGRPDTFVIYSNFLWLVGAVLLPFVAAVVAQVPLGEFTPAIALGYLLPLILIGFQMALLERHLRRHPEIRHSGVTDEEIRAVTIYGWVFRAFIYVMFVLSIFLPAIGIAGVMLLFLVGPLSSLISKYSNYNSGTAGRTKLFSDAVIAVAITVLVLPLVEIEVPEGGVDNPFFYIATHETPKLSAVAMSFLLVAWFWQYHHRLLSRLHKLDTFTLVVNFAWLLGVVSIPFATEVIGQVRALNATTALVLFYLAVPLYLGVLLAVLVRHFRRNPELLHSPMSAGLTRYARVFGALFLALMVLSVAIAIVSPTWALATGIGLFFIGPLASVIAGDEPDEFSGPLAVS